MRKIRDFDDYSITRDGRVWSHRTALFRVIEVSHKGYSCVKLYRPGRKPKKMFVHRLVMLHYGPPPGPGQNCVDHINRVRSDNRLSNLRWVSVQENARNNTGRHWQYLLNPPPQPDADGWITVRRHLN